jgi:uncharacterized lipoprotein YajG
MTNQMLMLACAAALIAACGSGSKAQEQQTSAPPAAEQTMPPADVQLAVSVAQAIDAAPTKVDSILAAHNLTREGLDSLMYTIAADSAKAAAYTAARP